MYHKHCISKTIIHATGVTSIGDHAFGSCKKLSDIEIPESVTSIGEEAFYNCCSLTTVIYGGRQISKEEFLALF